MAATFYQQWAVEHVAGTNPPDYKKLKDNRYRTILFQPQDSRSKDLIIDAKSHGLHAGLWFDDPGSEGTAIRGCGDGAAEDIANIVREHDQYTKGTLRATPEVVWLDFEFSAKGYPTWRANTKVKAWARWTMDDGYEWQTWKDGQTGGSKPVLTGDTINDGTVTWHRLTKAIFNGWDWSEEVMMYLRKSVAEGGLPGRRMVVQPMGHQGDFNYGAYYTKREYAPGKFSDRCRISPQAYLGDNTPLDVSDCVNEIVSNSYVQSHYGLSISKAYIHPTLFPGNSSFYMNDIANLGPRGYCQYRVDYMNESDYTSYHNYMMV